MNINLLGINYIFYSLFACEIGQYLGACVVEADLAVWRIARVRSRDHGKHRAHGIGIG